MALIEDMEKGIPVQMSQMSPLHFVLQVDDLGIFLAITQHTGAGVQALLEVDGGWQLLIKKEFESMEWNWQGSITILLQLRVFITSRNSPIDIFPSSQRQ